MSRIALSIEGIEELEATLEQMESLISQMHKLVVDVYIKKREIEAKINQAPAGEADA